MLREESDIVVIGGGPAGLMAGWEAARRGCSVVVIEKDDEVGIPLNCGEAVTKASLDSVIRPDPTWIASYIHYGVLVSPNGHRLELHHPGAGYILDRPVMERDLASLVRRHGGRLLLGRRAVDLQRRGDRFTSVTVADSDEAPSTEFSAEIFIAADGVEGTMARQAGIDNRLDLAQTEAFLQYRLHNVTVRDDTMEIHVGSRVAPRSYAWIFPRGNTEANVGLGAAVSENHRPRLYLDRFVTERFPGAQTMATSCGTSPRYQGPAIMAEKNLLVVGDAGRLLDSVTGAGLVNAMRSGRLAGEAAVEYCRDPARDLRRLYNIYPRRFVSEWHPLLARYRQIREFLDGLSDADLDEIVLGMDKHLGGKTVNTINPVALLLGSIAKRPRLLSLARHLF
jgi:digeranylgeranylglycerophospholipid reductase